jgi:Peptidase family M23/S-layer homology domain
MKSFARCSLTSRGNFGLKQPTTRRSDMFSKPIFVVLFVAFFFSVSCTLEPNTASSPEYSYPDTGGGSRSFKVPIPPGYDWEITQSWKEHCSECNQYYSDWNYCDENEMSHNWNCCKYGWDFNLPGNSDSGKPVLATADGVVVEAGLDYGWGNFVVIDHGNNICSRYAHMLVGSVDHISEGQQICQGLKIGEIGDTGDSAGDHLHFQFEECDTGEGIPQRFTDGNGVPKCVRGDYRYDSHGNYTALILTNNMVYSCGQDGDTFGGGELPEGGWFSAECGALPGCPLIPNCGREWGHQFTDQSALSSLVAEAGAYLYAECALDGKADGGLHADDKLTRAEALKVPMFLYGLMDGCGASEPFADVDQDDWYFGVVACAVRYGIVNSAADYFLPNERVEFAEAAKFVVESASRAGVISIQDPSHAHFPSIPKAHWAYKYVETIYYYGGLDSDALSFSPGREIDRGDYFAMVASLSPCYCRNVDCENGCTCDQSVFACVDPDDNSSGTGGGEPDEFVPDVSLDCTVDIEDTQCVDPDTVLQIECDVTNNGDEFVNVNDLRLLMSDPAAAIVCQVTDDDYRNGVGYNIVSPGETKSITGHFDITCSERPSDGGIEVSLDLTHVVAGPNPVFADVDRITIYVPETPFAQCEAEFCEPDCLGKECGPDYCGGFCGFCGAGDICDTVGGQCASSCVPSCVGMVCGFDGCGGVCNSCPSGETCNAPAGQCEGSYQNPWNNCDPNVGYTVHMNSPGGTYEIMTSGPTPYLSGSFDTGALYVDFDCIDMPASILIHGGPQYAQAYLLDTNLPDFSYWVPFSGSIVIDPPFGASGATSSFTSTFPNLSLLVRTPNP